MTASTGIIDASADPGSHSASRVPVAIVGAGPTGLALALGLARHGVRSMVIEREQSTSEYSKAAGIHLRTREILRQWGVGQGVLDAGELVETLTQYSARSGATMLSYDFSQLDAEAERPGVVVLEQRLTEKLLLEAVQESGLCQVRFGAEAVSLRHGEGCVRLGILEGPNGEVARTVKASYVVGCDGASSFVRDALGLPFEGITYSLRPMLADVLLDDGRDALPWPRVWNGRGGLTVALRIRSGLWRIIGIGSRAGAGNGDDVSKDDVRQRVAEVLGPGPTEVVWAGRFRVHRRSSPRFRVGRILLAGDAAHVHSPVGGQGMNAGIQDAHNLAWKLARVLRGAPSGPLLDSYEVERREVVVESVSRYTDLVTRVLLQPPRLIRTGAFALLRALLRLPPFHRKAVRALAMIDLRYSGSPILDEDDRSAGLRLPDPVVRSAGGMELRLHDLLPHGPAVLEVTEERAVTPELPVEAVIRIGGGGYQDASGLIRGLLGGKDGWVLVRPDGHVAWARDSPDGLADAVARALGSPELGAGSDTVGRPPAFQAGAPER